MNFLQLVQRLSQEAQIPGNGPSAVVGQTGENRNLVNWIKTSWQEIETAHKEWKWRQKEFSFETQTGVAAYTPAMIGIDSDFSSWNITRMRLFTTTMPGSDALPVPPWTYDDYERYYRIASQAPGRPVIFAERPNDQALVLGPTPRTAEYTMAGWYYTAPQELVLPTDVPRMPAEFHMLIVYDALLKYAGREAAGEIYEDARRQRRQLMTRLEDHQLPAFGMPDSLA